MAAKNEKRFFKKTKAEVGNKSVKFREKDISPNVILTAKAKAQKVVVDQEKEGKKRRYFPNNSRNITEKSRKSSQAEVVQPQKTVSSQKVTATKKPSYWKKKAAISFITIGIFGNIVLGMFFFQTAFSYVSLVFRRIELTHQMQLWESIAQKYPQYRDAYIQGAILAFEVGDASKETYFVQQLKLIDPNYPWVNLFEQLQKTQ